MRDFGLARKQKLQVGGAGRDFGAEFSLPTQSVRSGVSSRLRTSQFTSPRGFFPTNHPPLVSRKPYELFMPAQPKTSVTGGRQAGDPGVAKFRHWRSANEREVNTVEAEQPDGGAEPEITILCLSDGIHTVHGQAIVAAPGQAIVLENTLARFQGEGPKRDDDKSRQGNPPATGSQICLRRMSIFFKKISPIRLPA